jgi:hypothetical protein
MRVEGKLRELSLEGDRMTSLIEMFASSGMLDVEI